MSREQPDTKTTVYYDSKCPMSRAVVDAVGHSTRSAAFDLRDVHKKGRLPFGKQAIEKEMHVVDREGRTYKGAEAILKVAEGFPHLRWPVRIARSPVIKSVASIGYRLVAGNHRLLAGPVRALFWLKITVVVAFCIGLLMSSNLWIGDRSYPLVPISSGLPQLGGLLARVLFAALFILAGVILLAPKPQRFIAAFLAIIAVFCLLDETRWQPWSCFTVFCWPRWRCSRGTATMPTDSRVP
jgi:predicted DCC family thiol-disulfide oxidoreductase YuxK